MSIHGIVLAAGRGERMAPLTDVVPKANLPVVDTHLIDRLISSLRLAGMADCTVGVGWKHDLVTNHLFSNSDNADVHVVNVARWEVGPLMTLVTTLQHIDSGPALVCPVDFVIDPQAILLTLKAHESNRSSGDIATLAVDSVSGGGTRVYADGAGHLTGIGREPPDSEEVGRSAMLLALEPEFGVLCRMVFKQGHTRVTDALQQAISGSTKVGYALVEGPWYDIDDIPSLLDANRGLLSSSTGYRADWMRVSVTESVDGGGRAPLGSGIVLEAGSKIEGPSLIGPGTTIRSGSKIGPFTVLGAGTEIGKSCSVKNAVVFGASSLPARSHIDSVVVHDGVVYGRK